MSIKVGEAYYEVFPQINKAAVAATRNIIGKNLSKQFAEQQRIMRDEQAKTDAAAKKGAADVGNVRKKVTQDTVAREKKAAGDIGKVRQKTVNDEKAAVSGLSRVWSDFSKKLDRDAKKNEGALHKLATQFRTIGTVARGLGLATAISSSFGLLLNILGGIIAAGPLVAASLALIPPAIAAIGVEAVILKAAFKGVGKAISDAFNPAKSKQYAQDLKNLTPAARSFVKEIAKAKGILPNIQQTFFSAPSLQRAGGQFKGFLTGIRGSVKDLVKANGGLFGGILGTVTSRQGTKDSNNFIKNLATSVNQLTPGFSKLTKGFLTFVSNVSNQVNGKGLSNFLSRFGTFLGKVDTATLFSKALKAFHAFGAVLKDIGTSITGIIKAMGGSDHLGERFFQNVGGLIHNITTFVNSKTGQAFLKQLFSTLDILSSLASHVVKDALKFIAGAFAALYPAIKPVADEIKKITDDLVVLGPTLGVIGSVFLNVANTILKDVEPTFKFIANWLAKNPGLVKVMTTAVVSLFLAFKLFSIVTGIIKGLNVVLKIFDVELSANPIGLIVVAIAALIIGLVEAYKHCKTFRTIVDTIWRVFKTGWLFVWRTVIIPLFNYLKKELPIVGRFFRDLWLKWIWPAIKGIATGVMWLWNHVLKPFPGWVVKAWRALGTFFTKTIPGWLKSLEHWFLSILDSIKARILRFWRDDILKPLSKIKQFFTATIPGWARSLSNQVIKFLDGIRDRGASFVKKDIIGTFTKLRDFFTKTIPGWAGTLKHDFLSVLHSLVVDVQNIWHKLADVFSKPIEFVINHVMNGANSLIGAWNAIVGAIPGVGKHLTIPKFVSPGEPGTVPIPSYAAGGYISRGYGGPTQDNVRIPGKNRHPGINVSGGEFVFSEKAVSNIGLGALNALHTLGRQNLAGGGAVYAPRGTRSGTSFPIIEQFVRSLPGGSGLSISATTGGGHIANSYHYSGEAVDWVGSTALMNQVAREIWQGYSRYMLELIHSPSYFAHNGIQESASAGRNTYQAVFAGHFGHIHTAMTKEAAAAALAFARTGKAPIGGSIGSALSPFLQKLSKTAGKAKGYLGHLLTAGLHGIPLKGSAGALIGTAMSNDFVNAGGKRANDGLARAAAAAISAASAFAGPAGVPLGSFGNSSIDKWIAQASKYTSIPASWIPGIKTIIQRESGGNPRSINLTDSNAKAGHPSIGLMQVIKGTFEKYRSHALPDSQYDPVANIVAAVNYIRGRYGSIFNVQQANPNLPPRGYSVGTNGAQRGWAMVGEQGPEMMFMNGGEHILSHPITRALMGYAKGTAFPKSFVSAIHDISTSFVKSASEIKHSVVALTRMVAGNVKGSRARTKEARSLIALIKTTGGKLEKLSTKLTSARPRAAQLTASRAAFTAGLTSKLSTFSDLTALPFSRYDAGGAAADFIPQLKQQLSRAKTYTANIKKLDKLGFSKSLLATLASTDDGEGIIASLATGSKSDIASVNSLVGQINSYAVKGTAATATAVYSKSIAVSTKETMNLTKQMKRVADALEGKVGKTLGIHKAAGGFVPRVPGITGDNVPILATPGELVVPVGGNLPMEIHVNAPDIYIEGVKMAQADVVHVNNKKVIASLGRRSGR